MDDQTAVLAVLPRPALNRFRQICEASGPLEPRFDGYTKHVLLTADRAFLFPRNRTIAAQLERECAVYATVGYPSSQGCSDAATCGRPTPIVDRRRSQAGSRSIWR